MIKVLKSAVKEYKEKSEELEKQLKKGNQRNAELELELQDKEDKYLTLYSENNQLHEQLVNL